MPLNDQEILFAKLEVSLELFNKYLEDMKHDASYREQHRAEHEFLRAKMREAELRAARWEKIIPSVASMTIWSIFTGMFLALGYTLKDWVTGTPIH